MSIPTRTTATHLGAFIVGALIATAIAARADTAFSDKKRARYRALDTFAQTLSIITSKYVDEVDEAALLQAAAQGMASSLDKNSAFYDPTHYKRLREDVGGEYGGIGITSLLPNFDEEDEHTAPTIVTVVPDSPAARAGILPGDLLESVDGHRTGGKEVIMSGDDWLTPLRGPVGTRVSVRVSRSTWNEARTFVLVRQNIKVPTIEWAPLESGIGYIAIARFQEATVADLELALEELARGDLRALILDLRDNPGGLVDQAVKAADLFIPKGPIVTIRSRPGVAVEHFEAYDASRWSDLRILALVDQDTASAAEIMAAALKDHDRATLLGVKTYGKGSVQTFFDLDDGSGLKLTTAYYYSPDGNSLDARGIEPDVHVEVFSAEVIEAGGDVDERGGDESDAGIEKTWTGHSPIPRRLRDDQQFDTAYQTVRAWLESKPGTSKNRARKPAG